MGKPRVCVTVHKYVCMWGLWVRAHSGWGSQGAHVTVCGTHCVWERWSCSWNRSTQEHCWICVNACGTQRRCRCCKGLWVFTLNSELVRNFSIHKHPWLTSDVYALEFITKSLQEGTWRMLNWAMEKFGFYTTPLYILEEGPKNFSNTTPGTRSSLVSTQQSQHAFHLSKSYKNEISAMNLNSPHCISGIFKHSDGLWWGEKQSSTSELEFRASLLAEPAHPGKEVGIVELIPSIWSRTFSVT